MTSHHPAPTAASCVSPDAEFTANLFNPATQQIVTLQTNNVEQPLDAHLDESATCTVKSSSNVATPANDACPTGPPGPSPLADVVDLHTW